MIVHDREPRPATTHIKCPKCRSRDLSLIEVGEVSLTWHVENGRFDREEGWRDYGGALHMAASCKGCGHYWRLRGVLQITDVCVEDEDRWEV